MALPRKVVLIILTVLGIAMMLLFGYYVVSTGTGPGTDFNQMTNFPEVFDFAI